MKKIITLTLFAAVLAINTNAQDLPMIRSKDALRTYALEQAAVANAQIWTSLPDGNNANYNAPFVPLELGSATEISNAIAGMPLAVDVANPYDPLYTWAGVYNGDGDQLFWGYSKFNLVQTPAPTPKGSPQAYTWVLPAGYGNITLKMADNIPIRITNAQAAFVDILGTNGQTQQEYSLDVYNSKVYFPWRLTETNAILAVFTNNPAGGPGGWEYWNVGHNTGSKIQPQHFSTPLTATIQGIVPIKGNGPIFVSVPTTNGVGNNLTVELQTIGNQGQGYGNYVSFWTTEGKWFKGAWVRQAGTSQWQWYSVFSNPYQGMMVFVMYYQGDSVYYIVPDWNDGDLVEPADPYIPPQPTQSSGGGEG